MNQQPLVITGEGYEISLTKEALIQKDRLIKESQKITVVADKADEALAISGASELQAFIKGVENARVSVKQPALDFGRKVDKLAADAVETAKSAVTRIKGLLGIYQEKLAVERRKIEEEARKRQAEAEKALRDAEEAQRRAEIKPTAMTTAKAEIAEEKAIEKRVEVMQLEQQAAATKVKGGRMELDFEVEDIDAFYSEHPELCTITIKTRETKEWLKRRAEKEKIECPQEHGLKVFLKPTVRI